MRTLALLPLPLLLLAGAARAEQPEIAIPCAEGAEPVALVYGAHTTGCSISPATDVDLFTFTGAAGDVVRLCVHSGGWSADPRVEVYDPGGALLVAQACSGGTGGCSFCVETVLPLDGDYTVLVSDDGTNETFSYTLQLERIPPAIPVPGLPMNTTVTGSVAPVTDLDFWSFEGKAGTTLRFSVHSGGWSADPRIEVYAPNETDPLFEKACGGGTGGCSFTHDQVLPADGTYYLAVRDDGTNETFSYSVGVTCLFGGCPVTPAGLSASATSLSLAAGGTVDFDLAAGPERASDLYLLFGSSNGFSPGVPLGGLVVPLNLDGWYVVFSIAQANLPPFVGTFATLDAAGDAAAAIDLPPATDPGLAGTLLHHAFLAFDELTLAPSFASNAVPLTLAP